MDLLTNQFFNSRVYMNATVALRISKRIWQGRCDRNVFKDCGKMRFGSIFLRHIFSRSHSLVAIFDFYIIFNASSRFSCAENRILLYSYCCIVFCCNELFKFSYLSSVPLRRAADPSDSDSLASSEAMLNGRKNKK